MDRKVWDFHGSSHVIRCDEEYNAEEIESILITPFLKEFEMGWMSDAGTGDRIRAYLNYVGTLMIRKPAACGV